MEATNKLTIGVEILQSSMDVEVTPTVAMDPNKLGVRTLAPFISSISTQTDREIEHAHNYNSLILDEQFLPFDDLETERKVDKSGFNWIATTTEMIDTSSDEDEHNEHEQQVHNQVQTQVPAQTRTQTQGQGRVQTQRHGQLPGVREAGAARTQGRTAGGLKEIKSLTEEDLLLHSNDTVNLCFHENNPMEAIAAGRHVSIVSHEYTLQMRNSQMANAAGCDYDVRSIVANKFSTRHLLPETNELDFICPDSRSQRSQTQTQIADDTPAQQIGTEAGLDLGLDLEFLSQMEDEEDDRDQTITQANTVISVSLSNDEISDLETDIANENDGNDNDDSENDSDGSAENATVIEIPSVNELIALNEANEMNNMNNMNNNMNNINNINKRVNAVNTLNELHELNELMGDHDYTLRNIMGGDCKASTVGYSPSVSPRTRLAGITSANATPAMGTPAMGTPAMGTPALTATTPATLPPVATPARMTLGTPTPVVPFRPEARRVVGTGNAASTTPSPGPKYSPSHLFADIGHSLGHSRMAINASSPKGAGVSGDMGMGMTLSITNAASGKTNMTNVTNMTNITNTSLTPTISPTLTTAAIAGEVSEDAIAAQNEANMDMHMRKLMGEDSANSRKNNDKETYGHTLKVPSLSLMTKSGSSCISGATIASVASAAATTIPPTPSGSPASDSEDEKEKENGNGDDGDNEDAESSLRSIRTVEVINLREIKKQTSDLQLSGVSDNGLNININIANAAKAAHGLNSASNEARISDTHIRARGGDAALPPVPPVSRAQSTRHHKRISHTRTNTNYGSIFNDQNNGNNGDNNNNGNDNNGNNTTDKSARIKTSRKRVIRKIWTRPKAAKTTKTTKITKMTKTTDRHSVTVSGTKIIYPKSARRYDNDNDNDEIKTETTRTATKMEKSKQKRHTLPEKTAPPVVRFADDVVYNESSDDEEDDDIPFPDYSKNTGGNQSAPLTGDSYSRRRRRSVTRLRMGIPPRPRLTPRARERARAKEQERTRDARSVRRATDVGRVRGVKQVRGVQGVRGARERTRATATERASTRSLASVTARVQARIQAKAKKSMMFQGQPTINENGYGIDNSINGSINGSSGSSNINGTRRESNHFRMGTVQAISNDIDSKRELIAALGKITLKFDSLFPFYRLSDKDCKHLSLMVYQQFDNINRVFCNAHGRYLEALIYYKGSLVPEKLAFFNYDDLWSEVKQWHDIKMGEKYCLTEMGFAPNDRRRTF